MCSSKIAAVAIAALFASGSAFAQTQSPPQTQTSAPQKPTATPQTEPTSGTTKSQKSQKSQAKIEEKNEKEATQTFTGCVMTEPAYRQAHNLGKGALGGAGLGDEYVLVDVKTSPDSDTSAVSGSASASSDNVRSNGKCADQGMAYRLTGSQEKKIKGLVGQEIEVRGRFKHADDVTPEGTVPGEKLPAEVEIVSFHAVGQATMTEPAAPRTPAPAATVPRPQTESPTPVTPAQPTTPATTKSELPHTASSTPLLALIGVLALTSGFVLSLRRRRAF
jgi:LPXTG-motif cell wall-anchored protein